MDWNIGLASYQAIVEPEYPCEPPFTCDGCGDKCYCSRYDYYIDEVEGAQLEDE